MSGIMDTVKEVYGDARKLSKLLIFSYIVDWILILGTAGVGGGFNSVDPNRHTFSLTDPTISYSHQQETISTSTLLLVSLVAPGIIIAIASLLLVPVPAVNKEIPRSLLWRRKLWEWNAGWMGLGFALAGAFMVTEGLKDLYGKPRPDMLSRCDPDLSDIAAHAVSGLGRDLPGAPVMVSWTICRNKSSNLSRDGFVSFPSGHASFAWSGMGYLTLWICSKLAVRIPYLTRHRSKEIEPSSPRIDEKGIDEHEGQNGSVTTPSQPSLPAQHLTNAAPPIYLVILTFIPLGVAFYIASTRWVDNRHFGFDIICGSLIGIAFAWLGFRLYHPPLTRGNGWAWSARNPSRALFTGIGDEGWASAVRQPTSAFSKKSGRDVDVEQGLRESGDDRSSAITSGAAATKTDGEGNRMGHGSSSTAA
ncbi:hypothetical protein FQN54_005692 [Arachnomyces sp. PD_36]|nr:hypothetical protein FQN54_005692 [Arachnomyces sp. PD_36]